MKAHKTKENLRLVLFAWLRGVGRLAAHGLFYKVCSALLFPLSNPSALLPCTKSMHRDALHVALLVNRRLVGCIVVSWPRQNNGAADASTIIRILAI